MPELTPKERLQPSLLDRLTDDEPDKTVESREQRVMSDARLRASVVRDLTWLLNAENLSSCYDLSDCELAQQSVINYGIPPLSGRTASGIDLRRLTQEIHDAICAFEPRLIKKTVSVNAVLSQQLMSRNTLRFEINAELWAQPLPIHLFLMTEVDLETGHSSVRPVDR
jgi:type VI secretion system protein ImpF